MISSPVTPVRASRVLFVFARKSVSSASHRTGCVTLDSSTSRAV